MTQKHSKFINAGIAFYNGIALVIVGIFCFLFTAYKFATPLFNNEIISWNAIGMAFILSVVSAGLGYLLLRIGSEQFEP